MLAPVYNAINTLLARLTSARATLLDNLSGFAGSSYTSGRADKIDYLDGNASWIADTYTAVSSSDLTPARSARLDYADVLVSSRMRSIKSIQRGTITIADNQTSATATISAVVLGKSVLYHLGQSSPISSATDRASRFFCTLELTNETTITAQRGSTANDNDPTVAFEIVEYN